MTAAFEREQTVHAPADHVWDRLTDWPSAPAWMPDVESLVAEGPLAPGTTLRLRARGEDRTSTIEAVDPGRSVTLSSTRGGITARYRYDVRSGPSDADESSADESSAVVTLRVDVEAKGVWALVAPLVRRAIRGADGDQLTRFAAWVESSR